MGNTLIFRVGDRSRNIVLLRTYSVSLPGKYTQRLRRAGLASAAVPLRGPRPHPAVCFLSPSSGHEKTMPCHSPPLGPGTRHGMASTLDVSAKLSPSNYSDIRLFCFA